MLQFGNESIIHLGGLPVDLMVTKTLILKIWIKYGSIFTAVILGRSHDLR